MLTPELITEIIVLAAMVVPVTQAIKKWLKAGWKDRNEFYANRKNNEKLHFSLSEIRIY